MTNLSKITNNNSLAEYCILLSLFNGAIPLTPNGQINKKSLIALEEYLLSFVMHHITDDGLSLELLISEMMATDNELLVKREDNIEYKIENITI